MSDLKSELENNASDFRCISCILFDTNHIKNL